MIGETLSPARAGRSPIGGGGRQRLDPGLPARRAANETVDQIESFRHDMVARHGLEFRHIDAREQTRSHCASGVGGPPGREVERIARIENDRAALLHESGDGVTASRPGCGCDATIGQ